MYLTLLEPLLQILGIVTVSVIAPWPVVRRLRLDPLSNITLCAVSSFTLLYLLEFACYLAKAPQSIVVLVIAALSVYSALVLLRKRELGAIAPDGAIVWLAVAIWICALQTRIVVYGATLWAADWYEHYERARFFLYQLPSSTRFFDDYWSLPARAPMFNAVSAFFLGAYGDTFWSYQVIATVLNTLIVLPLALLFRDIAGLKQRDALLCSAILCMIGPFLVQSETFTWTKLFAVAFILTAIHLYLSGLKSNRAILAGVAMVVFAAGVLAHYLVALFAIFFGGHFIYYSISRNFRRNFIFGALAAALLMSTWLVYCFAVFGMRETFTGNSTFGKYIELRVKTGVSPQSWLDCFLGNLVSTALPYSTRHGFEKYGAAPVMKQNDPRFSPDAGRTNKRTEWLSDLANNPCSLTGSLGLAGSIGCLLALFLKNRRPRFGLETAGSAVSRTFWLIFFGAGIPLNILASRDYAPQGVAHLNLQPFVCLLLVFAVSRIKNFRFAFKLLVAIFLLESAITTGALLALQERRLPVQLVSSTRIAILGPASVNAVYVDNYIVKLRQHAVFLFDHFRELGPLFSLLAMILSLALLITMYRKENTQRAAG